MITVDIRLEEVEMVAIGEVSSWETVPQDNGFRVEAVRRKHPFTAEIRMKWFYPVYMARRLLADETNECTHHNICHRNSGSDIFRLLETGL